MKSYYDDRINSVVRYRIDPPPVGDDWRSAYNSITGLRLRVTDDAIEVRGFGPLRRLVEGLGKAKLSLRPRETTMRTGRQGAVAISPWRAPWPQADYVALSCELPDESEYTLAIRPLDGDLDRLEDALKMAGVSES
ncbi:MAG: hypothetical protein WAL31_08730 [Gaiellaceae bacterium]